jgi:hypothetical protein
MTGERPHSSPRRSVVGYSEPRMDETTDRLLEDLIGGQRKKLLELARRIEPGITPEDLLQPHNHPKISGNSDFNFEDGVLAGYLAVRAALRASR